MFLNFGDWSYLLQAWLQDWEEFWRRRKTRRPSGRPCFILRRKSCFDGAERGEFLVGFSRWMNVGAIAHIPIFPVTEELVYKYFCQLRRDGAPASRAARCLQAFGFAKGTIGADVTNILESARVKGACMQGDRFVAKKAPLSMQQVVQLEEMAMEGLGNTSKQQSVDGSAVTWGATFRS